MNEQNIPIDINVSRLLEWLISRRHCKKDWYSKAVIIREKISDAIKDMPVRDDVARLLSTIDINYFDCLKLIEILKETEANTKNMFGRYGSQRMKDWQEIMSLYERDNMYLAEAAQMLMKFVKYDIPSLKKQIQKLQQTQDDLDKETEKYKKSERTAKAEFDALCKQLNIPGKNIRFELCETAKTELPKICSKIAERAKSLDEVINFYEAYVQFTSGKEINEDSLKCLKHVIEKGNTMVTEFLQEDSSQQLMSSSDFDIVVMEDGNEKQTEETYDIRIESDDAYMENIKCENSGTDIICLQDELVVDFPAPTILEHQTMIDFMNDLFELEAFLKMRKYEFQENKEDLMAFSHIQETSEIVQLSNLQSVQSMLHEIQGIISNMSDSKYQHLYSIRNLPSYADTLTLSLQQKLAVVERMLKYQETSAQKKKEAEERLINLQPVLNHAVQRMKELQTEIEKDISKKYQNRIVHIRGGPIL